MKQLIYTLLLVGFTTGCAFVKLETDYNNRKDFDQYQSFCWLQGCQFVYQGPEYFNNFENIELIKENIVEELKAKGFEQDSNQPDFLINFQIIAEERSAITTSYSQEDMNGDRAWIPFSGQEVHHFIEGSLVIDVIDAQTSDLVWRAYGVQYFEPDEKLNEKRMQRAVRKALQKFPPQQDS